MREWSSRSLGAPGLVVVLASWLIAVPLVLAGTNWSQPGPAPAARAAVLPACTIVGTAAAETLVGTAGDDVICALGGADSVRGRGGDDVLFGSTGDDSIAGGRGRDRLYGHDGADRLRGGGGGDWLQGGVGPDVLSGGAGSDLADYRLRSGPVRVSIGRGANDGPRGEGDDVRASVERVRGGRFGDTLIGDGGENRLFGAGGDDALDGGRGDDRLRGGPGLDRLDGRDGARFVDRLRCGAGRPDTALADARDRVAPDCEDVTQPNPPRNDPPTDILLSRQSVAENQPAGTEVGTFGAADEDAGDTHRFALVAGSGGGDNAAFTIGGDRLRTAAVFDFEAKSSYSIRVRVSDGHDATFEKAFAITVADVPESQNPVNDAPLATSTSYGVSEDGSLPVDLGALVSDVETADANLTYTIATGPAHGALTGSGGSRTYTPDADYNGPDSFTYKVTDRGDPDNCSSPPCDAAKDSTTETVSITVDPVNDAPVNQLPPGPVEPVQDTDTPLSGISVTDVDAGTDAVELELSVAHGTLTVNTTVLGGVGVLQVVGNGTATVVITASLAQINTTLADATGLVYHGDAPYTGPDMLTVVSDDLGHNGAGGPRTDTDTLALLVVSPPNDPPLAASQSVSTNEDTATTITLSASDGDGPADLTFAIATGPAHGTLGALGTVTCDHLSPNVCSADVQYTPDANYNGPDSFTFTANDSLSDSAAATVSITVGPANDAPQLQATEPGALAYTENEPAPVITATTTVTDVDSSNLDTGTLTVDYGAGGQAEDRLEIRDQGSGAGQIGVSGASVTFGGTTIGTFSGGSGTTPLVVTFNASATPTAAQALIRKVTYRNVSENPSTATRTARFVLTDGDGGTSSPATRDITVAAVNDAPVVTTTAGGLSHVEGDAPEAIDGGLTVTDVDSPNLAGATVQLTGNYANGQDVLAAVAPLFGVTQSFDAGTGTLTLTGATTVANYQTILRAVTYENTSDAPSILARTVTFKVNDGSVESAGATKGITVTAVDDAPVVTASAGSTPYTEQNAAVTVDSALTVTDVDGGADPTGATVEILSPISGDTLHFTTQGNITGSFVAGVLTLSGTATLAQYQAALQSVQFSNLTSDAPGAIRQIRFAITTPIASNTSSKTIAITQVNDAPSTDPTDAAGSALEQTATAVDSGVVVSDPDSPNLTGATVQITGNFQSGQDTLQFTSQNGITGSAVGDTLTLTGSATVAQYQTALRSVTYTNTSDAPSTLTRTLTFRVTDDGTPGLQSAAQTRDLGVVPVNDAPTDAGESQTATGNTRLEVELTSGGSTNPRRTSATGNLLDNAADVDDAPAALSVDTGTVSDPPNGTVSVNADGSYFYTPDVGFTGADSFTYRVRDDENAQSGVSTVSITVAARIWYVRADAAAGGDGRSETPFNTLTAADTAASATGDTIYVFRKAGDAGTVSDSSVDLLASQRLLGSAVDLTDGVTLYTGGAGLQPSLTSTSIKLDDGNVVRGLAVSGSGSGAEAIEAGSGDVSGTLDLLNVSGSSGGIELANGAGGTWNLSDVTVSTTGGDAIVAASAGTVNFTAAGTNSVTAASGRGLNLSATTTSGTVDSTTVTSSPNEGIRLEDNPGSLTLNDINLTTTGTGLDVDSSNDVTVSGGDADITSAATAVNLTTITSNPANPPDVTLDQVTSSGGTTGINIDDIAAGTFSAAGGTLSGHSAAEIDVNAGSGNISYAGTIGNGSGLSSQITNRTAGAVTLSGNINDTNDAGGGIDMSANSGGTAAFSGTTKTLNTGAAAAFASTGSAPTINFTGGGLAITATTATGFGATGGGTVTVQGTGNTINSGTGTALNVANTTIGASGLNFQAISANGAPNGIVLSSTGASGGLTVTGTGAAGTGGTIQNSTDNGIKATNVTGLSLSSLNVTNNGNSTVDHADEGIDLVNLSGTASITDTLVTGSAHHGLFLDNTSGTLASLAITGSTFNTAAGGNGILFRAVGTAAVTFVSVTGSTFSDNQVTGMHVIAEDAATISDFTVSGNTFTDQNAADGLSQEIAMDFNTNDTGNLTFKVLNNTTITGQNSHAMNIATGAGAGTGGTLNGRITGNVIGTAAVAGSGSAIGNCMRLNINGGADANVLIDGNTLRQCPNGRGMEIVGRNGTGGLDVTATNNNVNPMALLFPLAAILVQSNCVTVCNTVRADVRGNTVPAASTSTDLLTTYIALVETGASTLQLVDTAPANANCTDQLTSTNSASASANAGCALIAGPINTPP